MLVSISNQVYEPILNKQFYSLGVSPFADIVLLSFNAAMAIPIQMILAILFLKEIFIWRYDIPALFFIILGSGFIILTANF